MNRETCGGCKHLSPFNPLTWCDKFAEQPVSTSCKLYTSAETASLLDKASGTADVVEGLVR